MEGFYASAGVISSPTGVSLARVNGIGIDIGFLPDVNVMKGSEMSDESSKTKKLSLSAVS